MVMFDDLMMVGDMRWFSKFVSQVMNLKLHITLPSPIRSQKKWKFCIWDCPMFIESNRTVPNSTKMTISITILLGACSSNRIGGTPINYAWLNSPTIILCFLDIAEAQFQCGWKRELFLSVCILKYYFFRLSWRLLFRSFQDLTSRGCAFSSFGW